MGRRADQYIDSLGVRPGDQLSRQEFAKFLRLFHLDWGFGRKRKPPQTRRARAHIDLVSPAQTDN